MLENRLVSTGKKKSYHQKPRRSRRQKERVWLQTTALEDFEDDPTGSFHERTPWIGSDWDCTPIFRWLDSQDGKHWQDVLHELHQRTDSRTDAGRLIREMAEPYIIPDPNDFSGNYCVDDDGIFHRVKKEASIFLNCRERYRQISEANRWLDGRLIRRQGSKLYWAYALDSVIPLSQGGCILKETFRQAQELTEAEYDFFESFHEKVQEDVLDRFDQQLAEKRRLRAA